MNRMLGIEISSFCGLKKPPKISPRANFKVFFNPRDEEISVPDKQLTWQYCVNAT